jgi:hypothetical protein
MTTVAARSKAWTVLARCSTEIVGSNTAGDMDVCVRLFCVCVALCVGSGLATGWSAVQGVLSTVYKSRKPKERLRPNKGAVDPKKKSNDVSEEPVAPSPHLLGSKSNRNAKHHKKDKAHEAVHYNVPLATGDLLGAILFCLPICS